MKEKMLMNPVTGSIGSEGDYRDYFRLVEARTDGADTFENAELIEVVGYKFEATFERHPGLVAVGEIWCEVDEPHGKEEAKAAVYGTTGGWCTETGHHFEAGCPTSVEVTEI